MFQPKQKHLKVLSLASVTSSILLFSSLSYGNEYIDSAQKYLNKHDISSATIQLKNAIQSEPKNAQPRLLLGKIYLQNGNFPAAETELSRALHLGASRADVLPLLARTLIDMGKFDDAVELIDESTLTSPAKNADLQGLKAIADLNQGHASDAKTLVEQQAQYVPDSVYLLLAQARLRAADKDLTGGLEAINQALKLDNNNSDIWILKGHFELSRKNFDDAASDYKQAFKLSPSAIHYSLFIARALVLGQHFSDATPYVDTILKLAPNHPLANDLKATILYSGKHYQQAKQYADRALNNGSTNVATSLISAVSDYQLKLYEQANRRLKQVLPKLPKDHFANRLYIVTLIKLGYINQAIKYMNDLDVKDKDNSQFLSKMSMALSKLGRSDEALSLANKAYQSDKSHNNELMLGLVKLADNDASGLKELQDAIAQQPDQKKAAIGVAYYDLKLGKIDEANQVADTWLAKNDQDPDALMLKGRIALLKKQPDQAEKLFTAVLQSQPNDVPANTALAQVLMQQKQYQKAYDHALTAKRAAPDNKSAIQTLFIAAKQLKKIPDLLSLLNQQITAHPDDLSLVHQKSFALVLNNQAQNALTLLENIPDDNKTGETWSLIGNLYAMNKLWLDADRAYGKWLALSPNNEAAYLKNIQMKDVMKKYSVGLTLADKAARQFPEDTRFTLIKAHLLIKTQQLDEAQNLLNTLPAKIQQTPYAITSQVTLYEAHHQFKQAITLQEQLYDLQPGLVTAKELASLYVADGQAQKAIHFLSKVMDKFPKKGRPLQILLADIQGRVNPDDGIKQYQAIIQREGKNVIALNNIAWLYMNKQQYTQACDYAARAFKLAGKNPEIKDTQGYCLLKAGQANQALPLLQQAYQATNAANPEIALHYVESLIKNHKQDEAKSILTDIHTHNRKLAQLKTRLENMLNSI